MADENNPQLEAPKSNLVRLIAPEDASTVSVHGNEYAVKDGAVEVPHNAVSKLLEHGYALPRSSKRDK